MRKRRIYNPLSEASPTPALPLLQPSLSDLHSQPRGLRPAPKQPPDSHLCLFPHLLLSVCTFYLFVYLGRAFLGRAEALPFLWISLSLPYFPFHTWEVLVSGCSSPAPSFITCLHTAVKLLTAGTRCWTSLCPEKQPDICFLWYSSPWWKYISKPTTSQPRRSAKNLPPIDPGNKTKISDLN